MRIIKEKGFILYETLIVLSILVLFSILLPPLFANFNRFYIYQSNFATAQIQNQFSIDAIAEEARLAKGVLTTGTVNSTLYTTATTTLVLEYPVFDTNGDVVASETNYGVFYLDPSDKTNLKFELDASANSARTDINRTHANDVAKLIFRYNANDVASTTVVTTLIKTSITTSDITSRVVQTSAFSLRNQ